MEVYVLYIVVPGSFVEDKSFSVEFGMFLTDELTI